MNTGQAKAITHIMCNLTTTILYEHVSPWLNQKFNEPVRLDVMPGRGGRTYHQKIKLNHHKIVYGPSMVLSKFENRAGSLWTTEKEIASRGYYNGDLSLTSLLAHTCCHEFSHFIQVLNGWRYRGDVHNDEFYSILDRLHQNEVAENIRVRLHQGLLDAGLPIDKIENMQKSTDTEPYIRTLKKGDPILIISGNKTLNATFTKSNRTTINIIFQNKKGRIHKRAVQVPV